jgi:hypothetical protein
MGMPGVEQAIAWQYEMSRQRDGTAAYLRLCCKTIFTTKLGNIDSRTSEGAHRSVGFDHCAFATQQGVLQHNPSIADMFDECRRRRFVP